MAGHSRAFDSITRLPTNDQSIEDSYGEPENFLEISVDNPMEQTKGGKVLYVDYEIVCSTNMPCFKKKFSTVRRRYSDFEWLRNKLITEQARVNIPPLPGKAPLVNSLNKNLIETRREKLELFLQIVAGHPLLQTGSKVLVPFIQDPDFDRDVYDM
ncbi:Sorting nexin-3 [Coemansia thaxteri]|uniref:Sorting nexin-3 n=1 Tax=Coemansia thaxteri TaxID=2663907 RepID=A0A9W8EK03_9FUNG|nr:Sorting nexin-3 [Coemansia thaxteri]KAJ2007466.1 Sorting nexin-3 [Coemansia thaxteri]KAJ2474151.1 Sorting nexin-3 [Coemansia sp. RSA 2322]KAJ2484836.1 Sorting nexin-3 [Coemansia sp. RSA 2320]